MHNSIKYLFILLITLLFFSCDSDNNTLFPPVNDTKPVWPQVGYNGRHTGNRYGINVQIPPVQTGNIYWIDTVTSSHPNDGSESSIDALGNIYFRFSAAYEGHIIKFRPDGTRIWEKDTLHNDCYNGFAFSNDETRIYYSDWYKTTCRDSSGNLIWSIPEGNYFGTIPCIAKNGTIYTCFASDFAAITTEGNIKWRLIETDVGTCWPVLDRHDNVWVRNKLPDGSYELLKIDENANISVRYSLSALIYSVVIDGYDNVYFNMDGNFVSLSKDGKLRWNKHVMCRSHVPAVNTNNEIITDSLGYYIVFDKDGNTIRKNLAPNLMFVEPYIILDDEDNVYFNFWYQNSDFAVCSLDKWGNLRWQNINPVLGWVLPGLTLSPLGMLFDTPKRPSIVFTIK